MDNPCYIKENILSDNSKDTEARYVSIKMPIESPGSHGNKDDQNDSLPYQP